MVPSIALRQGYLEKVHLAQIKSEKDDILSRIGQLQPGLRDVYLQDTRRRRDAKDFVDAQDIKRKRGDVTEDELSAQLKLKMGRLINEAHEGNLLHRHVDILHDRNAALTERIPKKAVGL